ncbi:MAG: hypothetical protein ABI458_05090 [Chloroflexota bacterium]
MTRDDDFIGQLEGYLDEYEGLTPLPDAVRNAIRAELPTTRQIGWLAKPMRRFNFMNSSMVRFGLAAAAIVLVVLLGIRLLPGANVGSDATPTPEPTPTVTPLALRPGLLEPGTYVMSNVDPPIRTSVQFTFTVPAGWSARPDDLYISKQLRTSSGELSFVPWVVTHVYADACHSEGTLTAVGPTVDDLVAALVDQANSDATAPVDVEVGGYPAKFITMSVPTDLIGSTCRFPGMLIQIWADPAETDFFALPVDPANPAADSGSAAYIVDVNGERVVILSGYTSGSSAADIAELESIIGSIHFEP